MDEHLRQMIEENNRLLKENLEITREHTKKIDRINRRMRRGATWKILYWLILLGISIGVYYYTKPYIDNAVESYNNVQEQITQTKDALNNPAELLKQFVN